MTSPLGLTDAVRGFIDADRQRRDDDYRDTVRARETAEFDQENAARVASKTLMDSRAAKWVTDQKAKGIVADPAQYKASGRDMLDSIDQYASTYARSGNIDKALAAQGKAAPIRQRLRAEALQQYNSDKDLEKLFKSVYDTIPDGDEIDKVEVLKGGPARPPASASAAPGLSSVGGTGLSSGSPSLGLASAPGTLGAPSGPDMVRVTTKSGKVWKAMPLKDAVASVQGMIQDPVKQFERDLELAYVGYKATAEAKAKLPYEIAKDEARSENDIKRDKAKGEVERGLKALDHQNALELEGVRGENSARNAGIGATATVTAAKVRAGSDGDGAGNPKTLSQANRAVETARNALHQARTAAISIRLPDTSKMKRMSADERAALVDADPQVRAALEEYNRALGVRNRLAAGGAGLSAAPGPDSAPAAPEVLKFDASGNLVK